MDSWPVKLSCSVVALTQRPGVSGGGNYEHDQTGVMEWALIAAALLNARVW